MTFIDIMRYVHRPEEKIYLIGKTTLPQKDEFGFAKTTYGDIQELTGVIQRDQIIEIAEKGTESEPKYIGYFIPDFMLETSKINEYRIRHERPHETLIMKIVEYNPNLFLEHTRDHIQMTLIVDKKV